MTTTGTPVTTTAQTAPPKRAFALMPRLCRFSLRALFGITALAAWCSWQWSIAEKRERVARELCGRACSIYRDATVASAGIERIYLGQAMNGRRGEPIKQPAVAALLGIGNWNGLTAIVYPSQLGGEWERDRINELSQLPGLTTVLVCSANVEMLDSPVVDKFELKLRAKLPRLRIKRVLVPPIPVGFQPYKGVAVG